MIRTAIVPLLMVALAAPSALAVVTFDWAYVGNAGNAPDPETGLGAVAYDYAISKHEVTNAQYTEFLNAVDPTGGGSLRLFYPFAGFLGGIDLLPSNPNGTKYVLKPGREQNPVTIVSFRDAMRFVNWLHNGQGAGDTETGVYKIGNGVNEVRLANAKFWIPNENEWYKAAYHDASAGKAGVYFDYATSSNTLPVSDQPSDNSAAANYFNDDRALNGFNNGYALSGTTDLPRNTNPYSDVGAYTNAASPYGTFDQNGNVFEWNESVFAWTEGTFRGYRGGSWDHGSEILLASRTFSRSPTDEYLTLGFRVASVPEPTTLLLVSLLSAGLLAPRRA